MVWFGTSVMDLKTRGSSVMVESSWIWFSVTELSLMCNHGVTYNSKQRLELDEVNDNSHYANDYLESSYCDEQS